MSNRSNDRTNLCAFTFADGRHCRMPRCEAHIYLCAFHARKEAQAVAGEKAATDIAYHLSGAFLTACDLSVALGRLFTATTQGQVKPKIAATLAYLGHTLVQTMRLAQHEYINAFGTSEWRETVRHAHEQCADYIYPDSLSAAPEPPPSTVDSSTDSPDRLARTRRARTGRQVIRPRAKPFKSATFKTVCKHTHLILIRINTSKKTQG